jgi:hypothetical protein
MKRKPTKIIGWVLSALISAFLILGSARGKFVEFEGKAKLFEHLGYNDDVMKKIGYVEVALALLFLVPRVDFLAAVLLTGYLGGATATHVRVGDPFYFPVIMGILVWVALGLRRPEIFPLAIGCPRSKLACSDPPAPA